MRPWIALFAILLLGACGKEGGDNRGPCGQFNWRDPTTNQIVCPYTQDCACPSTDVCCMIMEGLVFKSASCTKLASCSGLAFECDGPEDCPTGEACCVDDSLGGGSSCMDPNDCLGSSEAIMCRADEDCTTGKHCQPALPDSFFEGVAGYCE